MSLARIKKIVALKEKNRKLRVRKSLSEINSKKNNISKIKDFKIGYLSASRKVSEISGYEMNNTFNFVKNLETIENLEVNSLDHNVIVYNTLKKEWIKSFGLKKSVDNIILKYGTQNAYIIDEDILSKQTELLVLIKEMGKHNG